MNNLANGIVVVNGKEINKNTSLLDLFTNAAMKVSSKNKNADFKYVYFKSDNAIVDGKLFRMKGTAYNYRIMSMELYPKSFNSDELTSELGKPDFDDDDIRAWYYPWGNVIEEETEKNASVLTIGYF